VLGKAKEPQMREIKEKMIVGSSGVEPEPYLLVGAVTRCGSDNGIKHGWESKIDTKCNSL
jgi:hypothetical protein